MYFLPVNIDTVEEVIKKEKPDSIILSMGGQTGLNTGVELWEKVSKYTYILEVNYYILGR